MTPNKRGLSIIYVSFVGFVVGALATGTLSLVLTVGSFLLMLCGAFLGGTIVW